MKKNAQIKFGETIGVIIIVYMILMVGLIWYNNYNSKDLAEIREKDLQDRAFEKFDYLNKLSLIHVSQRGIIDNEFDLFSLIAFSNVTQNKTQREFYSKQLGEATIIIKIYNSSNTNLSRNETQILLYNLTPNENKNIIKQENYISLIPVYDAKDNTVKLGLLKLTNYITDS